MRLLNKTKRTGANGAAREIRASIRGNDTDGGGDEIHGEGSVRLAEMKNDGSGVRGFDGGDHAKGAEFRRFVGGIPNEFESGFHVGGRKRAAVVETDIAAEMENVSERIGRLPGFGEVAVEIHLVVALEEAAEEQAVHALGLGVGGEARVEVGGAGFNQEGEGRRIAVR